MTLTNLALWLSNRYSTITTPLGWSEAKFGYVVDDVLEKLDIADEADVDAADLHKVGIYFLLKQALIDVTMRLESFSADGASYNWGDLQSKIERSLQSAYSDAASVIGVGDISIDWGEEQNPYRYSTVRDNAGHW